MLCVCVSVQLELFACVCVTLLQLLLCWRVFVCGAFARSTPGMHCVWEQRPTCATINIFARQRSRLICIYIIYCVKGVGTKRTWVSPHYIRLTNSLCVYISRVCDTRITTENATMCGMHKHLITREGRVWSEHFCRTRPQMLWRAHFKMTEYSIHVLR